LCFEVLLFVQGKKGWVKGLVFEPLINGIQKYIKDPILTLGTDGSQKNQNQKNWFRSLTMALKKSNNYLNNLQSTMGVLCLVLS
jgi:hypothetical protein